MDNTEELAYKLGCRVRVLFVPYIGLSLNSPFKLMEVWDRVEEWFCKRL